MDPHRGKNGPDSGLGWALLEARTGPPRGERPDHTVDYECFVPLNYGVLRDQICTAYM